MQALRIYRAWQFDSMEKSLDIAERLLTTISDDTIYSKRDGGDGWTISEVLGHLIETEALFLERAKLTMTEDNPDLPFGDPDQTVKDGDYASKSAVDVLAQWRTVRAEFLTYLKAIPADEENTWERPAQHPNRGAFSLNDQVMLAGWHDTNHLEQVVKIINQ